MSEAELREAIGILQDFIENHDGGWAEDQKTALKALETLGHYRRVGCILCLTLGFAYGFCLSMFGWC